MKPNRTKCIQFSHPFQQGKLKSFGLTIDSMCNADIDVVDEQIKNLMNHQIKAYQIIHIARRCRDEFEGDVPQTKAEMMTLPGKHEL